MPLTFPSSPTVGQTYNVGTRTWTWDGSIWSMQAVTLGVASISTSELVNGAVTTAKIADDSITTAKIAAGAVVEADIASNAVTAGKLGTDVQLGYRNVVINGAMQIAQRGTSVASITTDGYRTADRWKGAVSNGGTWTQSVETDAPTGSGFRKSLKMLCTTADASLAGTDNLAIFHLVEGQNLQQFLKGTASAKGFTLTFWVKSNVTGTYIAELSDLDNNRQTSISYTISASATWEKKTIAFAADTTGAFDNDNAASLQITFWLGAGPSLQSGTLQTTWASNTTGNRAVGQTNLAAAINNYWQITGVQLEAGSVATPFEFEDYGETLRKCQRYYETSYVDVTVPTAHAGNYVVLKMASNTIVADEIYGEVRFAVVKRAQPTVTIYPFMTPTNTGRVSNTHGGDLAASSGTVHVQHFHNFALKNGSGASITTNNLAIIFHFAANSEL